MSEHPVEQEISKVVVAQGHGWSESYQTGTEVTRIEACHKSGLHADIPYVRVWENEKCVAEFCQHNIVGVYFK